MNIIIPMAGIGKRLRPHTLTVPKPLVPVAGKPIVQHLVEDIASLVEEKLNEIVFVTGRFGEDVEKHLIEVAERLGATGRIAYQDEALGTAHAIWCAKDSLKGKTIVAFADTLFRGSFELKPEVDGVLWVKQIDDPSAFGVVKLNDKGGIVDFVEKPSTFVSDLAMIGIYYFKEGAKLKEEIAYLIENKIMKSGEYQLPDALKRLADKGNLLVPGKVDGWMDCGNPRVTIETNAEVLKFKYPNSQIAQSAKTVNSQIIHPCYIGEGAQITDSVIGPYVSIGENSKIESCRLENSIIQSNTTISDKVLRNSMIGNHVHVAGTHEELNLGDYNTIG
jgi:glucose-1-phosphate thymidylyltransferase